MRNLNQYNELESLYIAALDSLITEEEVKYLRQFKFIGIDFDSNLGKLLLKENKVNIQNAFIEKYNIRTIEVSLDEIDRLESAMIMKNLGLVLKVDNFRYGDETEILFESIHYVSPIGASGFRNKMKNESGRWIVY